MAQFKRLIYRRRLNRMSKSPSHDQIKDTNRFIKQYTLLVSQTAFAAEIDAYLAKHTINCPPARALCAYIHCYALYPVMLALAAPTAFAAGYQELHIYI